MKSLFIIFIIIILADRVAPESKNNSVLSPLITYTESDERNIVMLTEQWKPIKNYENFYEVSNFGNIKSFYQSEGKILKRGIDNHGYYNVVLCKEKTKKTKKVHSLVWGHYGDSKRKGIRLQIDHIDGNKLNNRIDNLQLLTQRENLTKGVVQNGKLLPAGVNHCKLNGHWYYRARIYINGKRISLGCYKTPQEAALAYQKRKGENDV